MGVLGETGPSSQRAPYHASGIRDVANPSSNAIYGQTLLITFASIIDIIETTKIDGVIATNTTISREGLQSENKKEVGGLSGKPLTNRSTEVIRFLSEKSNKAFPIIGVGGIHSAQDALEKIKAGADLVQVYTGFIYEGPKLVKRINQLLNKV